jgi:hypothetical protein
VADWRTSFSKLSCVSAEIKGDAIKKQKMGKVGFLRKNYCCNASFKIISIQTVVPIAAKATTAAAMARILSSGLIFAAATGAAAGRRAAGAVVEAGAAALGRGWAAGVADERNVVEAGGAGSAPLDAPVGPPGGNVGSLMVGAAVGLGGRLMRTVSFLG